MGRSAGKRHGCAAGRLSAVLCALLLAMLVGFAFAEDGTSDVSEPFLQLELTELTLIKGKSRSLRPSVVGLPAGVKAGKYSWTSSDPDIAEYRDGSIRAKSGGEATVFCSVTLTDETVLQASCRVTVTVPVTELRTASRNLQVMKGDVFTPEIEVLPAEATDPSFTFASADESIVRIREDGALEAAETGKTTVTAASTENPDRRVRITVTVTRRIGKTDRELMFLGLPWLSDHETCMRLLKEKGFISEQSQGRSNYSNSVWHWPADDLLFSRSSAWRTLPVAFTDRRTGAERVSLNPLKSIGGFMPQTATLIYLNGIGPDGSVDSETTRLIGAYFSYDNRHEAGTDIFLGLLSRLEEEYGEFSRLVEKGIPRYYPELYGKVKDALKEAKTYGIQDLGETLYLGECVICTIRGQGNTGIMLSMDMNETVTLYYGRTDAEDLISELEAAIDTEQPAPEDAGV